MNQIFTSLRLSGVLSLRSCLMVGLILISAFSSAQIRTVSGVASSNNCQDDGVITITQSGFTSPKYQLINASSNAVLRPVAGDASQFIDGTAGNTFSSLPAGSYKVVAQEAGTNITETSAAITVVNNYVSMSVVANADMIYCPNGTGNIVITVTGGKPSYIYTLTNPPSGYATPTQTSSSSSMTFSGLPAGNYNFTVTDNCGSSIAGGGASVVDVFDIANVATSGNIVVARNTFGDCNSGLKGIMFDESFYYGVNKIPLSNGRVAKLSVYYEYNGVKYGQDSNNDGFADMNGGNWPLSYLLSNPLPLNAALAANPLSGTLKLYLVDDCSGNTKMFPIVNSVNAYYGLSASSCNSNLTITAKLWVYSLACLPVTYTFTDIANNATFVSTQNSLTAVLQGNFVFGHSYNYTAIDNAGNVIVSNGRLNADLPSLPVVPEVVQMDQSFARSAPVTIYSPQPINGTVTWEVISTDAPGVNVGFTRSATYTDNRNVFFIDGPGTYPSPRRWPKGNYIFRITTPCITNDVSMYISGYDASLNSLKTTPGCGTFNLKAATSVLKNTKDQNFTFNDFEIVVLNSSNGTGIGRTAPLISNDSTGVIANLSYGTYEIGIRVKNTGPTYGVDYHIFNKLNVTYLPGDIITIDRSATGGFACTPGGVGTLSIVATSALPSPNNVLEYSIQTGSTWSNYQSANTFPNLSPGNYNFRVKDNCGNIVERSAQIGNLSAPVASINGVSNSNSVCEAESIQLDVDIAGATSYNWTGPNGFTATVKNPILTGATLAMAGTYTVSVNSSCGTSVATVNLTVNPIPIATISYGSNRFCNRGKATVTQTGATGGTYSSTNGLAIDSVTGEIDLANSSVGNYIVYYSVSNGNCSIKTSTNVTVDLSVFPGVLSDVTAQCSITSLVAPSLNDPCSGTVTATTSSNFPITTQGTTIITWTYDYGNGYIKTANQKIVIQDTTKPSTPNLANVTGQCSATATAPTTTDNCSGTITGTTTDPVTYNTQGTHVINWTFTDAAGNATTATQSVVITDTMPPAVPTLANVIGQCSATATAPSTTDNCSGTVTGTTNDPLTYTTQGTHVINWTFTDAAGNTSTAAQNVVITDTTAPSVPTLANLIGQCSATATAPTTTDNCSGTVTGTTNDPLTYTTQGPHVINWTFTDAAGNTSTATQNVIITDTTAPAIPTLANVTGQCSATATAPTTTDNCSGTVTGTTNDPLTYTTQGTHVINWAFTDATGNTSTATQNVIITDTTAPAVPTLANVIGQCSATATAPTTTDNCSGTVTGTTNDPLTYTTQGTHVINWAFTDATGNTSTATQNVIITDTTAPAIPTLANVIGQCSATATAPTTTDNCSGTITGTTNDPLTYTTQGTHVINWAFTDATGNTSTATQNVIITDTTAPAIPTLANVIGQCSATATAPTTTDNCSGTITGTTNDQLTYTTQGTHVINWTFTDAAGNTSTATQNVIITDTTAPAIPTLANVIGQCSATATAPTTTDNCSGTVTGTTNDPLTYTTQGTHVINWTFSDAAGNTSTATQDVIITDTTAPAVPTLANVTGQCSATATAPSTTDNCSGTVTGTTNDPLIYTTQGTHVINWTFTDAAGNTSTAAQNVVITDTTAPSVPTLANVIGQCSATATAPTTTDNCSGTVTGTTNDPLTYSAQGNYVINWTFTDAAGNTSTAAQNVIVKDTTKPVVPTLANVTGQCSATATAPATTDNCSGTVTGTTNDPLTYTTQGTYVINWTFTDAAGNTSTAAQNVIVKDTTKPAAPTLANVTGQCSATATAPSTTDNCSGTVTGTTTDPLTYSAQGTYVINWTFTDAAGNTSTATQNVIVKDTTKPVVPTLANVTGHCSATATAPTTTDNCSGTVTGTTNDPLIYTTQGTHVINWTFTDAAGNTSTATQNVIVKDTTKPAAPTLANVTGQCSATAIAPTTTDNCSGTITGTTTDPLTYSAQGTYVINWTFTDAAGNTSTAAQNVIIKDTTKPLAPTLANVTGQCSATATAPSITDNCSGTVTGITNDPLTYTTQGTHVINWTFTNAAGNTSTATQNVIVKDTVKPIKPVLANVVGICSVNLPIPTTTDNCAGVISATTTTTLPITTLGTTTVTWSFNDGNGNIETAVQQVTLNNLLAPSVIVAVQPTCSSITGKINITPVAGVTFSVDGAAYSSTLTYDLLAGNHTVTAKNANGCISNATTVTINAQPTKPVVAINYGLVAYQAVGMANVTLTGQTGGSFTATPTGLSINAASGSVDLSASQPNQTYVVTYTYSNGSCSSSATATLIINSTPTTVAYDRSNYCANGSASVKRVGSAVGTYSSSNTGLKINPVTGELNLSASQAGSYTVTYNYQDGTINAQAITAIVVNEMPVVKLASDLGSDISKGDMVTLTASGGTNYTWAGGGIVNGGNVSTVKIRPRQTTTYTVTATNANGCSNESQITINVKEDLKLVPNNVITPNGDGKNDTWVIQNIDYYPNNVVKIFDRAGRLIFAKTGYDNAWDGKYNGTVLKEDVYFYVIDLGKGFGVIRGTLAVVLDNR